MKKSELFFSAFQVPVDFVMIVLAAVSAFAIRDIPQVLALQPKLYNYSFNDYLKIVILVTPIFILIYALQGLYSTRVTRKFWKEAYQVFVATSIGLVVIIIAIFLKREWFSSRFIILSGWMLIVFYTTSARFFIQKIQKYLLVKKGIGVHRVLLIGHNGKIKEINKLIENNKKLGYKVVGQLENGSVKAVKEIRAKKGLDEILVCDPALTDDEQEKLIDYCAINNITYKFIPTNLQTSSLEISILNGEPIFEVKHTPLEGWGKILKRVFDITGSIFLIMLFLPLMLIVAFIIWLEKEGPVIYKNERVGNDNRKFFSY